MENAKRHPTEWPIIVRGGIWGISSRREALAWLSWGIIVTLIGLFCSDWLIMSLTFFMSVYAAYCVRWVDKNSGWELINYPRHIKIILRAGLLFLWSILIGPLFLLFFNIHSSKDFALQFAAFADKPIVVKTLLNFGANIHAEDDEALMMAAAKGHVDILKILLDHGADIHAKNEVALFAAVNNGQLKTAEYLLSRNSDVKGCVGSGILRTAEKKGYRDIAELIRSHRPIYTDKSLACSATKLLQTTPGAE